MEFECKYREVGNRLLLAILCSRRLFIILVSLTVTLSSEKMLVSTKYIHMVSWPTWSKNLGRFLLLLRFRVRELELCHWILHTLHKFLWICTQWRQMWSSVYVLVCSTLISYTGIQYYIGEGHYIKEDPCVCFEFV